MRRIQLRILGITIATIVDDDDRDTPEDTDNYDTDPDPAPRRTFLDWLLNR